MADMICKWCGAPMDRAAKTCSRCGGERPALSDCGGFYDLVHTSQPAPVPVPARREVTVPRKAKGGIWMVLSALLALALVVALVMHTSLQADYQKLKDRNENNGSRGPQALQSREWAKQDVRVTVGLDDQENGYTMLVAPNLEAQVTVECKPDFGFGRIEGYTATVDFSGKEDARAQITLNEGSEGELQLRCLLDKQFGEEKDVGFTVESLIYVDEDGRLTQLSLEPVRQQDDAAEKPTKEDQTDEKDEPEEKGKSDEEEKESAGQTEENAQLVTVESVGDEAVITLNYAVLRAMAKEQELDESGSFRLTLCRANKQGGSFRVVVESIAIPQE